jgi:iron complex transport system ATP-binding protein
MRPLLKDADFMTAIDVATATGVPARLAARDVTLGYDRRTVARDLTVAIPDHSFTVIIGPNGCGKSTLLRALARLLRPAAGAVVLDGAAITALPTRQVARTVGLLPQSPTAPDGITVAELVACGRHPHQGLLRRWSAADERASAEAMAATGVADLADRPVDELSGGQRQRAWAAMALAQQTPLLLLDEPTTYLDIAHQMEFLDLCARLHREQGRTLVAVLHDLNQAARYADHLIVLHEGRVAASGPPREVITADLVAEVFGLPSVIIECPETGGPLIVPRARYGMIAASRHKDEHEREHDNEDDGSRPWQHGQATAAPETRTTARSAPDTGTTADRIRGSRR